jgi:hypothetical protein
MRGQSAILNYRNHSAPNGDFMILVARVILFATGFLNLLASSFGGRRYAFPPYDILVGNIQRKLYRERRAFIELALHVDRPAVGAHDLANNV